MVVVFAVGGAFSELYLAGLGGRGADPIQQAQPTLSVCVGDLAPGRMPGQAADREAFLVLLPAAEERNFT